MKRLYQSFFFETYVVLLVAALIFAGLILNRGKELPSVYAQTPPNCQFTATFTGTGTGNQPANGFQNLPTSSDGTPCVTWRVTYDTPASVTGLSIELDGAPSNSAGTGPGTYAALTANVTTGSNPSTNITTNQTFALSQYTPWVEFSVGTFTGTGTVIARAYGYVANTIAGGGGTGPTGPTGPSGASGPTGATGATGVGASNYSQTFTSQTAVTLTHNLGSTAVITACYDNASPPNLIETLGTVLTDSNDVTVTFSTAQSGKCIVSAGSGPTGATGATGPTGPALALLEVIGGATPTLMLFADNGAALNQNADFYWIDAGASGGELFIMNSSAGSSSTLNLTGNGTGLGPLIVTNNHAALDFLNVGTLLAGSNTTANNHTCFNLGVVETTNNIASFCFKYVGAGSASNEFDVFNAGQSTPNFYANNAAAGVPGTFTIAGESANSGQATCFKAGGLIGYCSTVVGISGGCTCN
jgi:hypothetical protein